MLKRPPEFDFTLVSLQTHFVKHRTNLISTTTRKLVCANALFSFDEIIGETIKFVGILTVN